MDFPYSLVVFDLDGTLVDSASDIAEAVNRTLVDWSLPRVEESVIRDWIGDGARALVGSAFEHAGRPVDLDEVMPGFMVHYADCLLLYPTVYPGVVETLQALRDRRVSVAVCTNKPERFVRPLLDALDLGGFFECIVGGDTLPARKPSAVPLLHVVRHFGLQPPQCLMVGDSATDVATAAAARMPMALVTYGYLRGVDPRAVQGVTVIDDMRELLG
ncbi:MAG: phosphoglycolate phosphatase [Lysobacteraceae bacterium]|nr:MAG: phosphoglycolate phosphatase [Xanthomonadaceae bacterium]